MTEKVKLSQGDLDNMQFYRDMKAAGRRVRTYGGRNFYKGLGATVGRYDRSEVEKETSVLLQQDSMGLDIILYPQRSMSQEMYKRVCEKEYQEEYDEEFTPEFFTYNELNETLGRS